MSVKRIQNANVEVKSDVEQTNVIDSDSTLSPVLNRFQTHPLKRCHSMLNTMIYFHSNKLPIFLKS